MKIVAIRPAALGDSLLVFPILAALRAKYTNAHITYLGHPAVLPLAKAWGVADEALNPAHLNWSELVSPKGIRSANLRNLLQGADLVICWLDDGDGFVRNALSGIGVEKFIIAPEREPTNATRHIVEDLAEPSGLPPIGTGFVAPANGWNNGFCSYNPPVAIHPGCSEENRRWPAASFATVINELVHLRYPVLLLAGPSEVEVLKEVRKHISPQPKPEMLSVLQNAPLLELAKTVQHCRGFLGNDSGISHLAGMLGIPTLVLFGPSNPATKHAIGPFVETLQAMPMKRLPVDKVLKSMLRMMEAR